MKKTKNLIKAHEAKGEVTMREHIDKMHSACQKACMNDERFNKADEKSDFARGYSTYKPKPYVVDITTPDSNDKHNAIIMTADNRLVRHGFDFNKDIGEVKFVAGDSKATESTRVYASAIEKHENMIKACQTMLTCRGTNGTKLDASGTWTEHSPVEFVYVPGGISTISAGFRENESITCTVEVDDSTAKDLQESFDYIAATDAQEPYADEDHEARKATLRFPTDKVKFVYGTLREGEGVIVKGAEPTSYGAECVNGKVYRSWSPEFATDADYAKAKSKKKHWTFPEGVRGSASNPARIVALSFVTGALTNKPAFKNMPPVKAKLAEPEKHDVEFVKAAKESDSIVLKDLQSVVCETARNDERFKGESNDKNCVWCCDLRLSDSESWSAIIEAKGKLFEVPFEITDSDPVEITLAKESKEVARKTEYISATCKKEFLLNGEAIKAKTWPERHDDIKDKADESAEKAFEKGEEANNENSAEKHKQACTMHKEVAALHEASAKTAKSKSESAKHSSMAKMHTDLAANHSAAAMETEKAKASNENKTILDTIYAQQQDKSKFLNDFAMSVPEVAAREAEKSKWPVEIIERIIAKKKEDDEFIERILSSNPLIQHREILEKVEATKI